MSSPADPFPPPEPGIDRLVRAQLDAEAARVDAGDLWASVRARLDAEAGPTLATTQRRGRRWQRGVVVAAAGLAVAVLVGLSGLTPPRDALATPAEVVESARGELTARGGSCYRMTVDLPDRVKDLFPHAAVPRHVWTRGRQFVVEPGLAGKGTWGRDGEGRVWAAPTREAAARFDERELPLPLRNLVRVIGLEPRSVLDEVLADFDLAWSDPPGADKYVVRGTRRTPAGLFGVVTVRLVIDRASRRIDSLVATRTLPDDRVVRLHLELEGEGAQPDSFYTTEAHLDPGAPVFDRSAPGPRRRLLLQHLGVVFARDI